ncbi:MAG: GTPase ObgE [Armatimonadetes bacterium]|nr:GTPase ObgE [Armatimonadota bacterium]
MSQFIDELKLEFESGSGGKGAASFLREKHMPRGGPNGADGGRGGDVVLVADRHLRTLFDLRFRKRYAASAGVKAVGAKSGRNGESITIRVPVGTVMTDEETGEQLVDLSVDGMRYTVCKGGKGGRGNLHFTTSVRQAPKIAQNGAPGEVRIARLELKLIADVGLVGLPNAGKSTLLSSLTAAKPKIADYPFTTITPNLGVLQAGGKSFVMADMPGLIEGASEGHGLGIQFLKHVERTKVLVHVVDCFPIDGSEPVKNFELVTSEIVLYSAEVSERPILIALNKIDVCEREHWEGVLASLKKVSDNEIFPISAVTGKGTQELIFAMLKLVEQAVSEELPSVLSPEFARRRDPSWSVARAYDGCYIVKGDRLTRLVAMTQLDSSESLEYLHRRLQEIGVISKLQELGVEAGDTVKIGEWEFEYRD